MGNYILGIDQSTQGTKAMLFDKYGKLCCRTDLPHKQKINEKGWVSHDPEEIYANVIQVIKNLIEKAHVDKCELIGIGISNQRETALVWDRRTGTPLMDAVVWQCSRAAEVCEKKEIQQNAELIREHTGINLSPYFPAAKISWILDHIDKSREMANCGKLCCGTIDSWLIYKLTGERIFKTDYSNAARTQLFNIMNLKWDEEICDLFGIPLESLPDVCDSDSEFGMTDLDGYLDIPIPIHGVLGDSNGALFGQGCLKSGMVKATYGTGSSIMMNIGSKPVLSKYGVVTSLAWRINKKTSYVLEGNINYTGAVISWLKDNLGLLVSSNDSESMARTANDSSIYLIPAFTGLGAPYWDSKATGSILGMTRTTGKKEIVRAGLDSIVYQIADIVFAMRKDSKIDIKELRVDGGPTKNKYLMQFQSDILGITVNVPETEELSGMGAAYMAGIAMKFYTVDIIENIKRILFKPQMSPRLQAEKYNGWQNAVRTILTRNKL